MLNGRLSTNGHCPNFFARASPKRLRGPNSSRNSKFINRKFSRRRTVRRFRKVMLNRKIRTEFVRTSIRLDTIYIGQHPLDSCLMDNSSKSDANHARSAERMRDLISASFQALIDENYLNVLKLHTDWRSAVGLYRETIESRSQTAQEQRRSRSLSSFCIKSAWRLWIFEFRSQWHATVLKTV